MLEWNERRENVNASGHAPGAKEISLKGHFHDDPTSLP